MPYLNPPSVIDQPRVVLTRWSLLRTDNGDVHAIGYSVFDRWGRVSSALVAFDPSTRVAKSASGRLYELDGEPGVDGDALYVLPRWCAANGVSTYDDVTAEILRNELPAKSERVP